LCLPSLETEHQDSQTAAQTGPSTEISDTAAAASQVNFITTLNRK